MQLEFAPFAQAIGVWEKQLELAEAHKAKVYGTTAKECYDFYDGVNTFVQAAGATTEQAEGLPFSADLPESRFWVQINKFAEAVDLFGPSLYQKYPNRVCRSRKPDIPLDALGVLGPGLAEQLYGELFQADAQDRATTSLLQWYLNYTPKELGLKHESLLGINDGIIKGRGVLEHRLWLPEGSNRLMPGSFYRSDDDLLIDPDATSLRDARWIALKCCEPFYVVEREYGWPQGSLREYAKGGESYSQQSQVNSSRHGSYLRDGGNTKDLLVYYKVYSKCGIGNMVVSSTDPLSDANDQALQTAFGGFGDHAFLVFCKGCKHPLNLPIDRYDLDISQPAVMDYFKDHFRWPLPFYADGMDYYGGWPICPIDIHPEGGCPWPRAHMKSALAEMKFINYCFSYLMGRMEWNCRTILAYHEALGADIKEQLEKGGDCFIPFKKSTYKSISEAIQFITPPPINKDFWTILDRVMQLFELRTGLTPLLYGQAGKQMRSAQEAQLREEQTMIRPDHMLERVEDWQAKIARNEAMMTRWKVTGAHVGPIFRSLPQTPIQIPGQMPGQPMAPPNAAASIIEQLWDMLVAVPLDYADQSTIERVVGEFEYTLESGSIRKPNREREQANLDQAIQTMFQPLLGVYQTTGDPTQINALISDWAKSRDLDAERYLLPDLQMWMQQQAMMAQQQQAGMGAPAEQQMAMA